MKQVHFVEFDGTTFGMTFETNTNSYKSLIKAITEEHVITLEGEISKFTIYTINFKYLLPVMGIANWLVFEKYMNKFTIEGVKSDEDIFIKYTNDMIDFRTRYKGE